MATFRRDSYSKLRRIAQTYAGLAYNAKSNGLSKFITPTVNEQISTTQDEEINKSKKVVEQQGRFTNFISSITPGINAPALWTKQHPIPDPKFEIISPGTLGALLLIKLPPRSEIFAAPGTAIAVSSKVNVERTTDGNVVIAVGRKLAGGSLIYHKYTTFSHPGDVLLGPNNLSDIAAIEMDGTSEYYVRKGALLARGPRVNINIRRVRGMGALNSFTNRVTGRGTIAISNYGSIYRLVLNSEEAYLVNAKHLIAWNSKTDPKIAPSLITPSTIDRRRLFKGIKAKISNATSSFFDTIRNSPSVKPALENMKRITVKTRKWAFGGPEFLQLDGPGDFYMSTRIEPVLGGFKSLTSPSVEEIVAAEPEPHSKSSNNSSRQYLPFIPSMCYALVTNDGNVTFTKPSRKSFTLDSPLSPPSPEKDNKSSLAKIVTGDGMLQLRRWPFMKKE
ncbi:4703_t:CDS:2 [Diversispora eburnea]|uniref:Altered inheritance of mitochondria protein 24, mitochondrial n=1 Tax=Diversispora eburnea TaxID=1213867 RepID=A0A9N8YLT4_9GLOM|nr:4703_t:CDS:2 [Diversispora eburnea]